MNKQILEKLLVSENGQPQTGITPQKYFLGDHKQVVCKTQSKWNQKRAHQSAPLELMA